MHKAHFYTLTASCPDQVGIISRVTSFIAEHRVLLHGNKTVVFR